MFNNSCYESCCLQLSASIHLLLVPLLDALRFCLVQLCLSGQWQLREVWGFSTACTEQLCSVTFSMQVAVLVDISHEPCSLSRCFLDDDFQNDFHSVIALTLSPGAALTYNNAVSPNLYLLINNEEPRFVCLGQCCYLALDLLRFGTRPAEVTCQVQG